uniref:DUF6671 domain-containing protein n=1 Tax=Rheinheimera sp. BAL341 TaxID=1708203 RepID=A0A486XUC1_9GAMM
MTVQAAILTRHDKARLIAPALSPLGWQLTEITSFDTDCLGSFSGERPRFMSPYECALRKAALAAELSGLDIGIGSEGSFSPGPYGMGTFNLELLCCVNVAQGWAVTGRFYGPSLAQQWQIATPQQLQKALSQVSDGQYLLLQQAQRIEKALTRQHAEARATALLEQGALTLSYDLRAHLSPQRQIHIVNAATDLQQRLLSLCPECATPGFWPDKAVAGLPCEACAAPTSLTLHKVSCCQRCQFTAVQAVAASHAQPQYCSECNP